MTNMMMERTAMNMPAMGTPGAAPMTQGAQWLMIPRCTMKMEKCTGGMKIACTCDDKAACTMMQNLCTMMTGGMVSCCMMLNGMAVCTCNLTMGICKCDMTPTGMTITCTSGDKACCDMIQACCESMSVLLKAGCSCCLCINNNPVCCGCC
jgi:hypothetical protein